MKLTPKTKFPNVKKKVKSKDNPLSWVEEAKKDQRRSRRRYTREWRNIP